MTFGRARGLARWEDTDDSPLCQGLARYESQEGPDQMASSYEV